MIATTDRDSINVVAIADLRMISSSFFATYRETAVRLTLMLKSI